MAQECDGLKFVPGELPDGVSDVVEVPGGWEFTLPSGRRAVWLRHNGNVLGRRSSVRGRGPGWALVVFSAGAALRGRG